MIALTLGEIAEIIGGDLRDAPADRPVTGTVEYDSRKITAGGLFVAFAGEHVDGHDFVEAAVDAGAAAAIVARPTSGPRIEVADTGTALTALATEVASRLRATVVGLTGSSGKTSTKDLIAALLQPLGPTVAPAGSMNNELGLPYTVLRADERTRFLVLEMGARNVGHIRYLCQIARPHVGVVLNVGSAHLGVFGSRTAIAQAKGELVEALPADGLAVLNADDPLVLGMSSRTAARVVTVGESPAAQVRAEDVETDALGRAAFSLVAGEHRAPVQLRLVGAHHVGNALAAAAVALAVGADVEYVARGLSSAEVVSRWRMEVRERADGVMVINDAYNANPESMRAALKALASVARIRRAAGGRSFAVLGPMRELGPDTDAEHDGIGRLAVRLDVSRLIAVGEAARPIQHGAALEGSWNGEAQWVPDIPAALEMLRGELRGGDVVLVKASRAAGLERVADALLSDDLPAAPSDSAPVRDGAPVAPVRPHAGHSHVEDAGGEELR